MLEKKYNEQDDEEMKALKEIADNQSEEELLEVLESDDTYKELKEKQRKMLSDGSCVFVDNVAYAKAVKNAKEIIATIADYDVQDIKMTIPEHNFLPSVFPDTFSILIECETFEIADVERFSNLIKETCEFGVSLSNDETKYVLELFYDGVITTVPNDEHDI